MRAARFRQWLEAKDPGFLALKRAVRVTLAACLAFYISLYVIDDTQMATFASFGCIAFGALSEVNGEPWQRTKTYAVGLLAGIVLVTLGTALAINTWAAAAGMFVVGFAIAYAGVGGPRVVGVANGLQLLYILPSFPPYVPDALGSRLIGLIFAVALLAIADRILWPPPAPTPFRHRLATAIHAVRDRLLALLDSASNRQPPAHAAVVPAFLGTVAGVAALVLALAGGNSVVYEVVFPFVMVIALVAGPLLAPAAGQAMFTLLVVMLFAQMAPVSWQLAEVRVFDVALGGLLGAVVGLLVWPRGAQGEMRRAAKMTLDAAANDLQSTVRSLTDREGASSYQQETASQASIS